MYINVWFLNVAHINKYVKIFFYLENTMSRKKLSVRRQNFIAALPDDDLPLIVFNTESLSTPTLKQSKQRPASVIYLTFPAI